MSGIETCVIAFQIWGAFFLVTTLAQIVFANTVITKLVVVVAGILGVGTIGYRWIVKISSRQQMANLSLVIVAFLITLDMVAALTE